MMSTSRLSALRALERLIGDAGRIGADLLGDHLGADASAPHLQLVDGRGAEGVGGGEHHAEPPRMKRCAILAAVVVLPVPFTPTSRITWGCALASSAKGSATRLKHLGDLGGKHFAHGVGESRGHGGSRRAPPDARGHGDAEIGLDQHVLELIERLVVELPLAEHRGEIVAERG